MKTLIKHYVIDTLTLYLVSIIISGIFFDGGIKTLLLTGLVLMFATLVIQPVINLLLLPINLVTFGLFKWVTYAITLYLVTVAVPGFRISQFVFSGYPNAYLSIPAISLGGPLAFIAFSFVISFISSLVYWIFK